LEGVVPVSNAFRNARLPILTNHLGIKLDTSIINVSSPNLLGSFVIKEAGENISHDEFNDTFTEVKSYLSSGVDLFVEDGSIGTFKKFRVGARVVTANPATALIFRNLLVSLF
jgi:ATP-dependent phosphoenolpyruvate carboxykinase